MSCIIILSGALNPVHTGHIKILCASKNYIETNINKKVVNGFLCPSSDTYVKSKLGNHAIKLKHRSVLSNILINDTKNDWIKVYNKGIASSFKLSCEIYQKYKNIYGDDLIIYEICGTDCALKYEIWNKYKRNVICISRNNDYSIIKEKLLNAKDITSNIMLIEDNASDVSSTYISPTNSRLGKFFIGTILGVASRASIA